MLVALLALYVVGAAGINHLDAATGERKNTRRNSSHPPPRTSTLSPPAALPLHGLIPMTALSGHLLP